jgi:hypothetical protein
VAVEATLPQLEADEVSFTDFDDIDEEERRAVTVEDIEGLPDPVEEREGVELTVLVLVGLKVMCAEKVTVDCGDRVLSSFIATTKRDVNEDDGDTAKELLPVGEEEKGREATAERDITNEEVRAPERVERPDLLSEDTAETEAEEEMETMIVREPVDVSEVDEVAEDDFRLVKEGLSLPLTLTLLEALELAEGLLMLESVDNPEMLTADEREAEFETEVDRLSEGLADCEPVAEGENVRATLVLKRAVKEPVSCAVEDSDRADENVEETTLEKDTVPTAETEPVTELVEEALTVAGPERVLVPLALELKDGFGVTLLDTVALAVIDGAAALELVDVTELVPARNVAVDFGECVGRSEG